MSKILLQVQLLLAALSALLPLVPADRRDRAAEILEVAAKALAFGGALSGNLDDLALELATIRADVEGMAATGEPVGAEAFDAAMGRVRAASAAFRIALAETNAG